jgi:hypothetical protein
MIYKLTVEVDHFLLYTPGPSILPVLENALKPTFLESRVGPSVIFPELQGHPGEDASTASV